MRALVAVVSLLALSACGGGGGGDPLARSCAGKAIPDCRPYEYAVVTEASLEPAGLSPGDVLSDATVHVVLARCEAGDLFHRVQVEPRFETGGTRPDGGVEVVVLPTFTVSDSGEGADAVRGDGVIDAVIDNPFADSMIFPGDAELILRFEPQGPQTCTGGLCGRCRGEAIELPYRTGPFSAAGAP